MINGVLLPELLTQRLSRRAVEIAQLIGPRKTGRGLNSLLPLYQPGIIGIEVPDNTAYMYDLEKGVRAHAMVDLAGKVIPIRETNGNISFRRASANKIGTIPIITRSAKDGRIQTDKREWYYPEKQGLSFLDKSLRMSVEEWKRTTNTQEVISILMQTSMKNDISEILYGRPTP